MGLGNNSGNAIYVSIVNGKIARKFKEKTAHSVQRTTEKGNVVHEEFHDYVEGELVDVKTRENDYGKDWQITMFDGDDKYVLSMPYSSGYSKGFLFAIPNANLSRPIRFTPWMKEVEPGKKKTALYLNQESAGKWEAVKWAYTKEEPNGLPQMKQVKIKGKETWDDSEQLDFLEAMISEEILPALRNMGMKEDKQSATEFAREKQAKKEASMDFNEEESDLPF